MPIVNVQLLPGRSKEVKAKIAAGITDVLINVAGGSREHCIVLFEEISADNWAIGGDTVSSPKFAQTQKAYQARVAAKG
jgi:4-oxalocrotonate tautomerase